jgi:hypothetical protein
MAGVGLSWWKDRDKLIAALAAAGLAWWCSVAMVIGGCLGLERFFVGDAAVCCVLVGVARRAASQRRGSGRWLSRLWLMAVSIPLSWTQIR